RRSDAERARDLMASALELALESDEERLGLERALRRRGKFDVLESALETNFARAAEPEAAARALISLVSFHHERESLSEARAAQFVERPGRVRRELGPRPSNASAFEAFQKLADAYTSLGYAEQAVELLDIVSASASTEEDGLRYGLEAARLLVEVPFRHDEA